MSALRTAKEIAIILLACFLEIVTPWRAEGPQESEPRRGS